MVWLKPPLIHVRDLNCSDSYACLQLNKGSYNARCSPVLCIRLLSLHVSMMLYVSSSYCMCVGPFSLVFSKGDPISL
jgi:hypothetical protein